MPFIGTSKESISFFESIGRPVPMYYNPADHYLEVLDETKRYDKVNNIESGALRIVFQSSLVQCSLNLVCLMK